MTDQDCNATNCAQPATHSWQRHATQAELDQYIASGDLPPGTTDALVMVLACADHTLEPDQRAQTHASACAAPPTCTC